MAQGPRDTTNPDGLRFADGFLPPLAAGEYKIEATQTLKLSTESQRSFSAIRTVHVLAPRFALGPDEIYSVYPPEGQSGSFHKSLPHVVFTRRTLPWEREIGRVDGPNERIRLPWMALLTLDDDEIAEHAIALRSGSLDELRDSRTLAGLTPLTPEPGEGSASEQDKANECRIVEMPTAIFREIAPALNELEFLAHARQVGTADKDAADMLADGWFAVVIGNRPPNEGKHNHALLVSLEGLGPVLKNDRTETTPRTKLPARIGLPILKHWQYDSAGRTFEELLDALTAPHADRKAGDVWLRISPNLTENVDETVQKALGLGYAALSHATRQGVKTVSWYRGPLVPVRWLDVGSFPEIHANADEALHYDDETGLFDVSYAAAWQLGRLLALQKSDFAGSLLHGRSGLVGQEVLRAANEILDHEVDRGASISGDKAKLLLQNDLMVAILTEWWASDAAETGGNGRR